MNSIADKEIDEEFNAQDFFEYLQQLTSEQRASCKIFVRNGENHLLSLKHIQVRHIQGGIITISQINKTNCLILNDERFPLGEK
jgi:hypothetical protein